MGNATWSSSVPVSQATASARRRRVERSDAAHHARVAERLAQE
jgi:hypothetical protein